MEELIPILSSPCKCFSYTSNGCHSQGQVTTCFNPSADKPLAYSLEHHQDPPSATSLFLGWAPIGHHLHLSPASNFSGGTMTKSSSYRPLDALMLKSLGNSTTPSTHSFSEQWKPTKLESISWIPFTASHPPTSPTRPSLFNTNGDMSNIMYNLNGLLIIPHFHNDLRQPHTPTSFAPPWRKARLNIWHANQSNPCMHTFTPLYILKSSSIVFLTWFLHTQALNHMQLMMPNKCPPPWSYQTTSLTTFAIISKQECLNTSVQEFPCTKPGVSDFCFSRNTMPLFHSHTCTATKHRTAKRTAADVTSSSA